MCLFAWMAFVCFWVLLFFDALFVGPQVYYQLRAFSFEPTPGRIIQSGIEERDPEPPIGSSRINRGPSFIINVLYAYRVNGQDYQSDRYEYLPWGTNDLTWFRLQEDIPVGAMVTVYYNPDDPSEATLTRGLYGRHVFMLGFLTIFHLFFFLILSMLRSKPQFDPSDKRMVRATSSGWELRLSARRGWWRVLWIGMAILFVSSFLIVAISGFNPPMGVAVTPFVLVLALCPLGFLTARRKVHVVADEMNRSLKIRNKIVSHDRMTGISLEDRTSVTTHHDGYTKTVGNGASPHACVVNYRDEKGQPQTAFVYGYYLKRDAERLAAWLREKLHLDWTAV